ncbi:hypothetical protein PVK06_027540 [Gossypium arboreum]|uniref:RNase H type-1 domain-containing protein n=1 Tax=Gossypium arboreum TaxID=29729 RepID=A0ABR0P1V1_GOSAR|nr:hypothetical protein PVK06_027540 [Gossypium arboreum]
MPFALDDDKTRKIVIIFSAVSYDKRGLESFKALMERDIAKQTYNYISELNGIKEKRLIIQSNGSAVQERRRSWVTIYFDADFDQQAFRSASGLFVRDKEGRILASKTTIHSEIANPFVAEAHARLQAVKLGLLMGLNKLEIVGDSKTVIKKYQNTEIDKSSIGAIIRDIQHKKGKFQEIKFHFIPNIENFYAHALVKEALKRGVSHYLVGGLPDFDHQASEERRPREPD